MKPRSVETFKRGDLVRVRHRGQLLRGVWHFQSATPALVAVRRDGMASPRYLDPSEVELSPVRIREAG